MFLLVLAVMIITGSVLVSQNPRASNEFNIGIALITWAIVGTISLFTIGETIRNGWGTLRHGKNGTSGHTDINIIIHIQNFGVT